jgi:hypothetical protein
MRGTDPIAQAAREAAEAYMLRSVPPADRPDLLSRCIQQNPWPRSLPDFMRPQGGASISLTPQEVDAFLARIPGPMRRMANDMRDYGVITIDGGQIIRLGRRS